MTEERPPAISSIVAWTVEDAVTGDELPRGMWTVGQPATTLWCPPPDTSQVSPDISKYHMTRGGNHLIPDRYHLIPHRYHLIPHKYHMINDRNRLIPYRYHLIPCKYRLIPNLVPNRDVDIADRFDISGPAHMMAENGAGSSPMLIDWNKEEHRRCVAACLVKGAMVMTKDRSRRGRTSRPPLAPAWWESFGFRRLDVIKDGPDEIFGAIYEYEPPAGLPPRHTSFAPRYVVAFRGTIPTHLGDLIQDTMIIAQTLPGSKRSWITRKAVAKLLGGCAKSRPVWLAGHSLGASHALDVGRFMANKGFNLPTFLFNPPQVSLAPAIDLLHPTEKAKRDIYTTSNSVKARLGKVLYHHTEHMEKLFERLASWAPELYVHERDIICKGYIDYFEKGQMTTMMLSYRGMFFSLIGDDEKELQHLMPSAMLWKNSSMNGDAHALQQWWKPDGDLSLSARRYSYP
uniref:Fungal lipase-like domain-containing protein n=1 Tax=Oryza punctata TaxID=4537 RepID=A0A0E0LLI8_ORYPU